MADCPLAPAYSVVTEGIRLLSLLSPWSLRHAARERAAAYCGKISRSAKRMNPSWSGPIWWM